MINDRNSRFHYLLQRYVDNTCDKQEMEEFFDYVNDPDYAALINGAMEKIWENKPLEGVAVRREVVTQEGTATTRRLYVAWGLAASLLIFVIAWVMVNFQTRPDVVPSKPVAQVTSKSTREEHRLVTTPDGSSVWLNSNSEVDFTSFSGGTREVTLRGEAYFDIKHDPLRPFIIHTGKVKTTVLGTAFNIRAVPSEESVTVTVTRGKVRVEDDKNTTVITANQQVSMGVNDKKPRQQNTASEKVTSWIREDLIMDNITFSEAVAIIEERYKVDVAFGNKMLERCRFTSTFLKDASLEQMLTAICIVNRATFEVKDKKVTVNGEGCDLNETQQP